MSKQPEEYLKHILQESDYLISKSQTLTLSDLVDDETLKRAFTRSLEIIGEATKKIPGEFKQTHPEIDWKAMAGMRDRLIHDYLGVDYEIVWDVIQNELPDLKKKISELL